MQVDSSEGKGKGKAIDTTANEVSMDEDDSSSDEDAEVSPNLTDSQQMIHWLTTEAGCPTW
jgi:hypothetical protein